MRSNSVKIFQKVLAYVLLFLVVFVTANRTFYTHTHTLDDGTVITHAHPYDKREDGNPLKSHHHSGFELVIFDLVNYLPAIAISFLLSLLSRELTANTIFKAKNYRSFFSGTVLGRAPPIFS